MARYPRDPAEIDKAITNAWAYARDAEGNAALPPPAAEAFAGLLTAPPPPVSPAEAATRAAQGAGVAIRFEDLRDAETAPPVGWLVPGMIPAAGLTLLFGPPKRGKTFAALDLALAVATGRPWLGQQQVLQEGPVVYLALEGVGALLERTRAWQEHYGPVPPGRFTLGRGYLTGGDPAAVAGLVSAIEALAVRPAALFVDTVARAGIGLDENDAKDMGALAAHLEALGERFGCPIIGIHHSTKADSTTLRGSGALLAAVEAAIEADMEGRVLTLTLREIRRGEGGKVLTAHAHSVGDTGQVVWKARPDIQADAPIPPEVLARQNVKAARTLVRRAIIETATSEVEGVATTVPLQTFIARAASRARITHRIKDADRLVIAELDTPGALRHALLIEGNKVAVHPREHRETMMKELLHAD